MSNDNDGKRLLVSIKEIVRVTSNHGGYMGAECIICGRGGWLHGKYGLRWRKALNVADDDIPSDLIHLSTCPMNRYAKVERDK